MERPQTSPRQQFGGWLDRRLSTETATDQSTSAVWGLVRQKTEHGTATDQSTSAVWGMVRQKTEHGTATDQPTSAAACRTSRRLCQVSYPLVPITGGSCHKYHFCHDNTRILSRQKYAWRDKTFVLTKLYLSRQNIFVATKVKYLWRQTRVCRHKSFVATYILFSRQTSRDKRH